MGIGEPNSPPRPAILPPGKLTIAQVSPGAGVVAVVVKHESGDTYQVRRSTGVGGKKDDLKVGDEFHLALGTDHVEGVLSDRRDHGVARD